MEGVHSGHPSVRIFWSREDVVFFKGHIADEGQNQQSHAEHQQTQNTHHPDHLAVSHAWGRGERKGKKKLRAVRATLELTHPENRNRGCVLVCVLVCVAVWRMRGRKKPKGLILSTQKN